MRLFTITLLISCYLTYSLSNAVSEETSSSTDNTLKSTIKPQNQKLEVKSKQIRRLKMDAKAKLSIRKFYSNTKTLSLCDAIIDENINEMKKLISEGANINDVGKNGITPLIFAVRYKKRKSYELLLCEKADPNLPLKKASTENGIKLVTFLNLMHAVSSIEDDPTWLTLALKHGGDPNSMGMIFGMDQCGPHPPIFSAIQWCSNDDNFRALMRSGADIHYKDQCNRTPFLHAVASRRYNMAIMLLDKGADWSVVGEWGQDAAFLCFIDRKADKKKFPKLYKDHLTLLGSLKAKGADIANAMEKANDYFEEGNFDSEPSRHISLSELEKFIEKGDGNPK